MNLSRIQKLTSDVDLKLIEDHIKKVKEQDKKIQKEIKRINDIIDGYNKANPNNKLKFYIIR